MDLKPYNYDEEAHYYDIVELKDSEDYEAINIFLDKLFKEHNVKTVLDLTCGTGAQAISLRKKGYNVTASDLSEGMLAIAKKKAKGADITWMQGDMRNCNAGKFDAVITIFNAIGHLTKQDFEKTIQNIANNLNDKGLYIFDIFNLDYMTNGGFLNHQFMDTALEHEGTKFVRFNNNKLNEKDGIIKINQELYIQKEFNEPKISKESWDMQIYTAKQLTTLLEKNGFVVKQFYAGPNKVFDEKKSLSIFVVAQKK